MGKIGTACVLACEWYSPRGSVAMESCSLQEREPTQQPDRAGTDHSATAHRLKGIMEKRSPLRRRKPSADECAALLWDMVAACGVQGAGCGHQLLLTPPFASSSPTDVTDITLYL
ncbi:hypothetical protein PAMP_018383 [Pampus punctatissimus]